MKLIYIRSTMEPKNYSTIRSILKKEQGEKIAPYIFKINDTQTLEAYLRKERITYEIVQTWKELEMIPLILQILPWEFLKNNHNYILFLKNQLLFDIH